MIGSKPGKELTRIVHLCVCVCVCVKREREDGIQTLHTYVHTYIHIYIRTYIEERNNQ
jgi:hypothetical protein